jgi:hypothetical protein
MTGAVGDPVGNASTLNAVSGTTGTVGNRVGDFSILNGPVGNLVENSSKLSGALVGPCEGLKDGMSKTTYSNAPLNNAGDIVPLSAG